MDTKYLPTSVVANALPRIQQALLAGDPTALAAIKEWGFESIARIYDPDPLFRPHHYLLKKRAETEWRRMLEVHERRLKEILLQKSEEAWSNELGERILDRQHQGTERRRRDAEGWNRDMRVGEYKDTRSFDTDERIREAQAMAQLQRQTIDSEPRAATPMDTVREIQAEIAAIERDSTLTNESKHRRIQALNKSIEVLLGQAGR